MISFTDKPIPSYIPQSVDYLFFVRSMGVIVKLFLAYCIVIYMAVFVHDRHYRLLRALLDPVMAAAMLEVAVNFFRHIIFYFDENLSLHLGPLNFTFYIFAVYFYSFGAAVLLINRKNMSRGVTAAVFTLAMLSMTGMLVQTKFPVKNFDLFIHSICCILMLYTLLDSGDLVLALTKKNEEIHQLTEQTMLALTGAIEAKDPYTSGHSSRVANYSREIAERMGLDEAEIQNIYYAALMHDVGKIGIPLVSRIIGVADAYDAMTTSRSYRTAQNEDYARKEIRNGRGKQFDPEIGKILLEILEEKETAADVPMASYAGAVFSEGQEAHEK
ncbi:MAG: HD domain-containing protein [Lachnospiraceae bacterium]|jgi:hypothetical protein|nr:HD domain-containing protein [Lachnospiraceae bacterium]